MKKFNFPVFLMLSAFLCLISCKKSKKTIIDEIPAPHPTEISRYLPVKFESKDFTLNLKYKENTALLEEMTDSDHNRTVLSYTAEQQLEKLEKYWKGNPFYIAYYERKDSKPVSKIIHFRYVEQSHSYTPSGYYNISYNQQQKISAIHYYNNDNKLLRTDDFSYSEASNLSAHNTITYPGPAISTNYAFDQKTGISTHILNSELLAVELEYWFFLCINNNLINVSHPNSTGETISFNYTYQADGYPSGVTFIENQNTQNIRITYKKLDP